MSVNWMFVLKILTVWLSATSTTFAQTPLSPPPPPVPVNANSLIPSVPTGNREYTFQAPNSAPETLSLPVTSQNPSHPSLYRVEVVGNDDSLLSQVKTVEPLAFIRQREGVIHAGVFQQPQQAQQRVQTLAQKGMAAQIIPVYENAGRGSWVPTRPVVPLVNEQ